jgi:hypothetical protein
VQVSQELIAILAVGIVVIGSHWRLDDDIDDLRERLVVLEQASQGQFTGTVTAGGQALSDVVVVATPSVTRGVIDNVAVHTDVAGRYILDDLQPGLYTLTFTSRNSSITVEQELSAGSTRLVDAAFRQEES